MVVNCNVRRGRQSSVTGGEKGLDLEKPFSRKTFLQGIAALVVILRGWAVGQPLLASPSEAAGSGLREESEVGYGLLGDWRTGESGRRLYRVVKRSMLGRRRS